MTVETNGTEPVLVAVEVRRVQQYVFATSRLLDSVGRSVTVDLVTDPDSAGSGGQVGVAGLRVRHGGQVRARGGGSFVLSFPSSASAVQFVLDYTRWVHETDEALSVVCAQVPQDPSPDMVVAALRRVRRTADAAIPPMPGWGVTTMSAVGAGPAEVIDRSRGDLVSAAVSEARARARAWHTAQQRDVDEGLVGPDGNTLFWELSLHLDELSDDPVVGSHLAVVHLDVNDLGRKLRRHAGTGPDALQRVDEAGQALHALVLGVRDHLWQVVSSNARLDPAPAGAVGPARVLVGGWQDHDDRQDHDDADGSGEAPRLTAHPASGGGRVAVMPVRPLVVAGDDLTVVCDARLAWSLVRAVFTYLAADTTTLPASDPRTTVTGLGGPFADGTRVGVTMAAGVAVFPTGSPVSDAYARAQTLTRWAKEQPGGRTVNSVAWDVTGQSADRLIADLTRRRQAGQTRQPALAEDLGALLTLVGRLQSEVARSWLKTLHAQGISGAELDAEISRRADGGPGQAWVNQPWFTDAVALLDWHVNLTPRPDTRK